MALLLLPPSSPLPTERHALVCNEPTCNAMLVVIIDIGLAVLMGLTLDVEAVGMAGVKRTHTSSTDVSWRAGTPRA